VSVTLENDGRIVLAGVCPVEDAEPLFQLLQSQPSSSLDWSRCSSLHTAILQLIIAARPALVGPCGDEWIENWVGSELERQIGSTALS
jgi:hypothetical protein